MENMFKRRSNIFKRRSTDISGADLYPVNLVAQLTKKKTTRSEILLVCFLEC